jgi:carboxypeptidase Q
VFARRCAAAVLAIALSIPPSHIAGADATSVPDALGRIRAEALDRSQILRTLHLLTDLYGPRLTGSPSAKGAADWAIKTLAGWGLTNAHLEPWDFGHPGWVNERAVAQLVSPVKDSLAIRAVAWTPGTNGTIAAPAFALTPPDRPTVTELTNYLETVRSRVKGRIVFAGRPAVVAPRLDPRPARRDEEQLRRRYDPAATPEPPRGRPRDDARPGAMTRAEVSSRIDQFLLEYGAVARVNDAGREMGQIVAYNNSGYDLSRVVPTIVMRNEDYGRISRILADGTDVQLELTVTNRTFPDGRTSYNAIAEIEGTDRRDEVVMLGGHLDSWHAATGATDNAIGCAVMMEAVRILKATGLQPRRTVRIALWTGEEQGLLGSRAYVREHFGTFEEPRNEFRSIVAYVNLDNGTGRVRGARVFGPAAAAEAVRRALAPFSDLGVVGAAAYARRVTGDTDSTSFNAAGLPGINFDQDPIQYDSFTHHTNLDTYERIVEDDVKASAIVAAGLVYQLAMGEERLPRFDRASMPPPGK